MSNFYEFIKDYLLGDTLVSYVDVLATAPTVVSSVPAKLTGYLIYNTIGVDLFVKFYNLTNPSSASTPVLRVKVEANGKAEATGLNFPLDTALSVRATTTAPDTGNVSPATNDLLINIGYRSL